jgi:Domain of unknown function (DUF4434)
VEDFKIFQASKQAVELYTPRITESGDANKRFLTGNPQPEPQMHITGSFIYAHPPNYRGRPAHHWTVEQWREMFAQFRQFGIDTAILQASLWNELGECYYQSDYFTELKQFNVVEPMLEAANAENIKIFLGGYGSVTGWSANLEQDSVDREKARQQACFKELLRYRELFDGFYFAPETAYMGSRNPEKEAFLNSIYRGFFETIKETDPSLRILMSPATKYFPGKNEEMTEAWLALLKDVPLDIMAPQDSIGTCGTFLENQAETYMVWSNVCKQLNIEFWSNIEVFQRTDGLADENHSVTASPERVAAQINNAAPYAKKLICWEAPFYLFGDNSQTKALRERCLFQQ